MPNDDETGDWRDSLRVPEGSRISLEELGMGTRSVQTFRAVDGQIVVDVNVVEPPVEPSTVELPPNLQAIYPRLSIVEEADPQHPEQGTGDIDFDFFVYIVAFQESFKARWTEGERSYGRLNPMYYYGGTNRTAEISFTLPASTVLDSRQNLNNCSQLSRTVYGRYKRWSSANGRTHEENQLLREQGFDYDESDFTLVGHRYFRVNLGSLIRNERAFISAFAFTVNQDAGVFDYDGSVVGSDGNPIDTDVTHSTKGLLLPKQVDVRMSIIFKHDYPLGFNGPSRATFDRTKWAPNNSKDFPHGTGNHPLQSYMEGDGTTVASVSESPVEIGVPEAEDV